MTQLANSKELRGTIKNRHEPTHKNKNTCSIFCRKFIKRGRDPTKGINREHASTCATTKKCSFSFGIFYEVISSIENATSPAKQQHNPHKIHTQSGNMTDNTTTNTTSCNDTGGCRRHLEESYVDAMEGRRTLRDVMSQIDGLGPSRRLQSSCETSSRSPKRRSEVTLINEVSNQAQEAPTPVRQQEAITSPRAESSLLEHDDVHGTMKSAREMVAQMDGDFRRHSWPGAGIRKRSYSRESAISILLDSAIAIVEEDMTK
jgi:hypothetical protein